MKILHKKPSEECFFIFIFPSVLMILFHAKVWPYVARIIEKKITVLGY